MHIKNLYSFLKSGFYMKTPYVTHAFMHSEELRNALNSLDTPS